MDIIVGSDHAGFDLKEEIKKALLETGRFAVKDVGSFSRDAVDYPLIAHEVAENISEGRFGKGILICGSGIGMSIVANRHRNVRAALCSNLYAVKVARQHNDANILVLGGRVLGFGLALEMVDLFFQTDFEGGRHQRRVEQFEISSKSD
jgi:ribose 5-phosphate isomerase B